MKAQKPAEGILRTHDFGNSKWYQVVCGCGQSEHDHTVEVEADDTGVTVNVYTTMKTNHWSETVKNRYDIDNEFLQKLDWFWKGLVNGFVRRVKLTWELWTTGAVTTQTALYMSEQQALNYAETLKFAIEDVKTFKKG